MQFSDFDEYSTSLLMKIEKKMGKQSFIRKMIEKKPEMVKSKLRKDFNAIQRTDREIVDFIEFFSDFVKEIKKEGRRENVGGVVELIISSLSLFEEIIPTNKGKHMEKTQYLRKLLKSRKAQTYIEEQRKKNEKDDESENEDEDENEDENEDESEDEQVENIEDESENEDESGKSEN